MYSFVDHDFRYENDGALDALTLQLLAVQAPDTCMVVRAPRMGVWGTIPYCAGCAQIYKDLRWRPASCRHDDIVCIKCKRRVR